MFTSSPVGAPHIQRRRIMKMDPNPACPERLMKTPRLTINANVPLTQFPIEAEDSGPSCKADFGSRASFRWVRMRRLVAFSLTCGAIVGLLDIALNCAAVAQAPLPSSITEMIPTPGSTFPATGAVTFSWNAVQGAEEYG